MDGMVNGSVDNNALIHNNIKYLHDLCTNKDWNVPALKSLFWTKCKLMELRTKVHLPSEQYKVSTRCSRCFLDRENNCSIQITPIKLSKYEQRLASRVDKKKNKVLTQYQQKCMAKIRKKFPDGLGFGQNQKVITCKSCNNKSTIRMLKPKKEIVESKNTIKAKKKKQSKIKDRSCGLNSEAVLEASVKKGKNTKNKKMVEEKHIEKAVVKVQPSVKMTREPLKTKNHSTQTKPSTSKNRQSERIFATSDFIPFKTPGLKFKLAKKQQKQVVKETPVPQPKQRKNKKKGPKVLSEKAKLELFLKNL